MRQVPDGGFGPPEPPICYDIARGEESPYPERCFCYAAAAIRAARGASHGGRVSGHGASGAGEESGSEWSNHGQFQIGGRYEVALRALGANAPAKARHRV